MPSLVWDEVGDRVYETGLDRGVLYLPNGSAVPWNGLKSVVESFDKESSPVYFDGRKINNLIIPGDFAAIMTAVTYPDEFLEIEGYGSVISGVFLGDQQPKTFGLSYRTKIGNDLEGDTLGYKIHIIYNLTATPQDKTYSSVEETLTMAEFAWNIVAVPEEISGFRPTAHVIVDSRDLNPDVLITLESMLYGSDPGAASLIPLSDLVNFFIEGYNLRIIDNGDGTWTAISVFDETIQFVDPTTFGIDELDATIEWLDVSTYTIDSK